MTDLFRVSLKRLALLTLIAGFALTLGVSGAYAQEPDADDGVDAEDTVDDTTDDAVDTDDTADDGAADDAVDAVDTDDATDDDTADAADAVDTDDATDDTADAADDATDDGAVDDGSGDDGVAELPSTGQGSTAQDGNGMEIMILGGVALAVIATFAWTKRSQRAS